MLLDVYSVHQIFLDGFNCWKIALSRDSSPNSTVCFRMWLDGCEYDKNRLIAKLEDQSKAAKGDQGGL